MKKIQDGRGAVMNSMRGSVIAATFLLTVLSTAAGAAPFSYDEELSGDIASSGVVPVSIPNTFTFDIGANTVAGRFGTGTAADYAALRDQDYFLFTVPSRARLQSVSISWSGPAYFGSLTGGGISSARLFNQAVDTILAEELPQIDVYDEPSGSRILFGGSLPLPSGTFAWTHGFFREGLSGGFEVDYQLVFIVAAADGPTLVGELVQDVLDLNLATGVGNALDSKLQNALDALDRARAGDTASAVGMIFAFIQSVEAQRGKALTDQQADDLIASAQEIIDVLSQP